MKQLFPLFMLLLFACGGSEPLTTVETLDLNRYAGKWYEVARLPNKFEDGLKCVTAEYTIKENGKVQVVNRGVSIADGSASVSEGEAKRPNTEVPGVLKVSFFKPFYGDYYVMQLDDEYGYALVGSPDREFLWILSRTPVLPKDISSQLMQHAENEGFDLSTLIWTEHSCSE
ncbi:lipocalin family protein [Sanyastnella coralliicola]|uniref:lipocalin family protein n=1 Tax=Sanyastnella coralliicola TaxID=3069118 RepID=UPI0027BA8BD4|nr:lipocalin family protein [Longitalea sp. SCSIO 12813]